MLHVTVSRKECVESIVLNFIPRFEVATLQPPQMRLIPKFGGLPWGLPADMWPRCRECSMPMALLAQLPHHGPALEDQASLLPRSCVTRWMKCAGSYGFLTKRSKRVGSGQAG